MELLVVGLAAGMGQLPGLAPMAADLVQKVSWSGLVCVGIAVGTAVSNVQPVAMGIWGALTAPLAFAIARGLHKAAIQALGAGLPAGNIPVAAIAAVKGIEYGTLSLVVGYLTRRPRRGARAYFAVGLAIGVAFGAATLGVMAATSSSPIGIGMLVVRAANELLFPAGCAVVLYTAGVLSQRVAT